MGVSTLSDKFPFKSVLSFQLLIEYWERAIREGKVPGFGNVIQEMINNAPELRKPLEGTFIPEKHKDLVNYLMTAAIAPAQTEYELSAATTPFKMSPFYATEAFKKTIDLSHFENS